MESNVEKKKTESRPPQIKICGLTDPGQAAGCAALGVAAIGMVFYPKSPRHVEVSTAKEICDVLPPFITTVGVFVDEPAEVILSIAERCGISAVQLHGKEPPETVRRLQEQGLAVVKALFVDGDPPLSAASRYGCIPFLVECAHGKLPGGNAMSWNWQSAFGFGRMHPLILAGGLTPRNVERAIEDSQPNAVDVSSGVESSPGQKDLSKVKSFVDAVSHCPAKKTLRKIFSG